MKRIVVIGSLPESLINFRGAMLRAMIEEGHAVTGCAPPATEELVDNLRKMGVQYRSVPMERGGLNPFRDILTLVALFRIFRELKPDLVLSYTIKPVLYGSLAARLAGVPVMASMITGLGYAFSRSTFKQRAVGLVARLLYKFSLRDNSVVFFQNPDDRNLFTDLRLLKDPQQAVLINGSGVDTDHFQPTPLPANPSFLLIARLIRDKGIVEYAEAARRVKESHPNVIFSLVGWLDKENPHGISSDDLRAWQDAGIINYLGTMKDVRPAIAASSVYVLPSFYREGTPRTILEAMAMGRAVITTDSPGCRETVQNGLNGYLVPPRDVSALARAMAMFIDNPDQARTMGQESRKKAVARYDVNKVNDVILKTLDLHHEKSH